MLDIICKTGWELLMDLLAMEFLGAMIMFFAQRIYYERKLREESK